MTAVDATANMGQGNKRRAVQLEKISDFLNQFQTHFLPRLSKKGLDNDSTSHEELKALLGTIKARDLQDALEFQSLLEKLWALQEEKFVLGECGKREQKAEPLTRQIADSKNDELDAIRKKIKEIPDRIKLIFSMLRRFEVWTSKLVAQDQLLTPTKLLPEAVRNKSKTDQLSFSPFLNIPPSNYFAKILPSKKGNSALVSTAVDEEVNNSQSSISAFHRKDMCMQGCTLGLPPNKHTWKAYARLALMASLIGDDELSLFDHGSSKKRKELAWKECVKSSSCVHNLNQYKKGRNPSLNHQYTYSPKSDLVPLWIRAQRNTQALRQLIQLFEVTKETKSKTTNSSNGEDGVSEPSRSVTGGNATVTNPENVAKSVSGNSASVGGERVLLYRSSANRQNGKRNDTKNTARFKATFRGNSANVRPRVMDVSEDVDRLIEWAVVNQSIFTYRHIRKEILTAPLNRKSMAGRKRQRAGDDSHQKIAAKKLFRGTNGEENLIELHQACQSYLLRWFARRNRNALTVLFSKRIENMTLDIGCLVNSRVLSQAKVLRKAEVPSKVQEEMQDLQNGEFYPEDRILSRIDRRLFVNGRYSSASEITCRSQVSNLLKSFAEVCPKNQESHKKLIDAAMEDLDNLFETFYPSSVDEKNPEDVYGAASRLVDLPHGCTESSITDLVRNTPAPWVGKCHKCKKAEPKDLQTCFNCEKVFHKRCAGSDGTTSTLRNFVKSFPPLFDLVRIKRPKNLDCPDFSKSESEWIKTTIHVQRKINEEGKVNKLGILFDHTEDCSDALRMIESDAFSLLEFMKYEENHTEGKRIAIGAKIKQKGCLVTGVHEGLSGGRAGLQVGDIITGLEILEYSRTKDEVKHGGRRTFDFANLPLGERLALLKVPSLQLNLIVLRPPMNIVKAATDWYASTKRENKNILDVLRGISTIRPWYCGSCVRKDTDEQSESVFLEASYCRAVIRRMGLESFSRAFTEGKESYQSGYFCLRRLDAMMTHIMGAESKDDFYDLAPGSFFAPSPVSSALRRLPWATVALESRPMELICKAMKTLLDSEFPGQSHLNTQRSALLRHFFLTFSSYCVGSTVKSKQYSQLKGPPNAIKFLRAPFYTSFAVPKTTEKTCSSHFFGDYDFRGVQQIDTVDVKEVEKAGNAMVDYLKNASFVGKTFLVLPSDPLVEHVSKIVPIQHENRPVEFVVASYLPSIFHDEVIKGRQKELYDQFNEKDGIYHLLPVISSIQQNYLLERCKMRNGGVDKKSGPCWMSLVVLNLEGVARYSTTALQCKMLESNEIRLAIDHATVQEVCASPSFPPQLLRHVSSRFKIAMTESSSSSTDFALEIHGKLLETLLNGDVAEGALRKMLDIDAHSGWNDAPISVRDNERSNRKILQREGNFELLEFGPSVLQHGLLPTNPVKKPRNILKLQNVRDDMYVLYYSDFFYRDEASRLDLVKKLHPPQLQPFPGLSKKSFRVFTLSNPAPILGDPKAIGWGFELLKWANERVLQVGRVQLESPAYRAGLRTHDIIEAINGVRFSWFQDLSSVVCSILGAPNMRVRLPRNLNRIDEISTLFWTINSAKTSRSPTILYVFRPSAVDNRFVRSGISASLSGPQIQPSHQRATALQGNPQLNRGGGQNRLPSSQNREIPDSTTFSQHPPQKPVSIASNPNDHQSRPSPANHQRSVNIEPAMQHVHQTPVVPQRNVAVSRDFGLNGSSRSPNLETMQKYFSKLRSIQQTYDSRPPVTRSDFYRPAKQGTILTVLEVSVFLESLVNRTWKLGVRMLMPRYEMFTILEQIKIILSLPPASFVAIPTLRGEFYQNILTLDYIRMSCKTYPETGPIILREQKDGKTYEYKAPIRPLPIDRSIEICFEKIERRQQKQIERRQQQQWSYIQQRSPVQYPLINQNVYRRGQNGNHGHNNNFQHQRTYQQIDHTDHSRNAVSLRGIDNSRCQDQVSPPPTNYEHVQPSVTPRPNGGFSVNENFVNLVDDEIEPTLRTDDALVIDEPSLVMLNESNHQSKDNPNQPNAEHDRYTERIRGGGGNSDTDEPIYSTSGNQNNFVYLYEVPRNQWTGLAVYTIVQTACNGSFGDEAHLVGFVERCIEVEPDDEELPDVEIEAYYLSGTGYFKQTKMHQSYSDEVWVINIEDDDCKEAKVIANLQSQKKVPSDYREKFQRDILRKATSVNNDEEGQGHPEETLASDVRRELNDEVRSPTEASNCQNVIEVEKQLKTSTTGTSCSDALRLDLDSAPYNYICEEQPLGIQDSIQDDSACHECSLCSLPFERSLPGNKKDAPKSFGCSLMSDVALIEKSSRLNTMPGQLGEGKTLLLKIASLVPSSLKVQPKDTPLWEDPLLSFRIFDNDTHYALWKDFVAECTSPDMLAQAFVTLVASIERSKLPDWWSRKDSGWSTPYAIMSGSSLSTLYLHVYVLDAALSDIISQSLSKKPTAKKSNNVIEGERMKKYWERSIVLGYQAFQGTHNEHCYHCNEGGHLLRCKLCPNVQHNECCDPELTLDAKLEHWLCDSCINDIDNFDEEAEFADDVDDDDDDDDDEDFR